MPKEKKSKVKKTKEKGAKTKEKKGKKGEGDGEEGGGGGKKKIIILVLLLLILGGGGGTAYFLVYLPMVEAQEVQEESSDLEPILPIGPIAPSGYYGYLSYDPTGNNQLFIDSVDIIKQGEVFLIEEMGLTEEQLEDGYYISNPQSATRLIYVDQGTLFNIISRETGEYETVTWNKFISHLSNSSILFEIESNNNILTYVKEFSAKNVQVSVNDSDLPAAQEVEPAEEVIEEEETDVVEETDISESVTEETEEDPTQEPENPTDTVEETPSVNVAT